MENKPGTANPAANGDPLWANGLTRSDWICVGATALLCLLLSFAAWSAYEYRWLIRLALSLGALGGLAHEIAQSGGRILVFKRQEDGIFLGSLGGVLLGAIAGLLAVKALAIDLFAGTAKLPINMMQVVYDVFLAGLGLKGVVEAAVGTPVKKSPTDGAKPPANEPGK